MFSPASNLKSSTCYRRKPRPLLLETYANDSFDPNVTPWLHGLGEPQVKDCPQAGGNWGGAWGVWKHPQFDSRQSRASPGDQGPEAPRPPLGTSSSFAHPSLACCPRSFSCSRPLLLPAWWGHSARARQSLRSACSRCPGLPPIPTPTPPPPPPPPAARGPPGSSLFSARLGCGIVGPAQSSPRFPSGALPCRPRPGPGRTEVANLKEHQATRGNGLGLEIVPFGQGDPEREKTRRY